MREERVAILHYTAPPVIGGVEAVINTQAQLLAKRGYPVTIIAGQGEPGSLPEAVDLLLIPELNSQHPRVLDLSAELEEGRCPAEFDELTQQLTDELAAEVSHYDHLIVHNVFTKRFNLPLTTALHRLIDEGAIRHAIAWCHDFDWTSPRSRSKVHPRFPWDLLRTYKPAVTYVTVSQQRRETLADMLDCSLDEIHLIYNGVDTPTLLGLTEEGWAMIERLDLMDADLILLMPVRVTRAKNIEYALRVVAALKEQGQGPKLLLTGPPDPHDQESLSYFQSLQRLRNELGLEDQMHFVYESGPKPDEPYTISFPVVCDLYRVSDLLLMPSHREGFGMPILEAGLVGLPVFCSTTVPAANEIGDSDVVQFDLDTPADQVAERILNALRDSPVHQLRRRTRQNYTWQALFEQKIEPLLETEGTP